MKKKISKKQSNHIFHKGNRLDQYPFIDRHKQEFGVRWLLRRMSIYPNAYYNYRRGDDYKKFENHLNREFHVEKPNEKWCTDFTYIFMEDGRKRYNCSIDIKILETELGYALPKPYIDFLQSYQLTKYGITDQRHLRAYAELL